MKKQNYKEPILETIRFTADVLATSENEPTAAGTNGTYNGVWGEDDPYE